MKKLSTILTGILFVIGAHVATAAPTSTIVQNLFITQVPNAPCLSTNASGLVGSTSCSSSSSTGSGTVGPSTSTYVSIFNSSTTITGFSNFTYTSSTGILSAPTTTFTGMISIGTSTQPVGYLANGMGSNSYANGGTQFNIMNTVSSSYSCYTITADDGTPLSNYSTMCLNNSGLADGIENAHDLTFDNVASNGGILFETQTSTMKFLIGGTAASTTAGMVKFTIASSGVVINGNATTTNLTVTGVINGFGFLNGTGVLSSVPSSTFLSGYSTSTITGSTNQIGYFTGTNILGGNASFTYNPTGNIVHQIFGLPPQSTTSSVVLWGNNTITGGNASGTFLGANPSSPFTGDFINLQVGSSSKFQVTGNGGLALTNVTTTGNVKVAGSVMISANNFTLSGNGSINSAVGSAIVLTGSMGGTGYSTIQLANAATGSYTSGDGGMLSSLGTYAPTSGTGTYEGVNLVDTINQTGGANGITRGFYINPTITSAADYRIFEVAGSIYRVASTTPVSNIGWVTLNAPTISARVGIGTTSSVTTASTLYITGAPASVVGSTTVTTSAAIYVSSTAVSASTTNSYGAFINAQTGGTNNYAATFMGGNVGIGTAVPSSSLHVASASSTIRLGTGQANPGCLELYDAANGSLNYVYSSSTTLIVTASKPTFCQ